MNYILDTCVVNWLIDGKIDRTDLPNDGDYLITHIQVDEINRTSDHHQDRRARLSLMLHSLNVRLVPTESTVWDESRWDYTKLGDGAIYASIKRRLDSLKRRDDSNVRDALIAEVAIINGHILLTADENLATAAGEHGGAVRLFKV